MIEVRKVDRDSQKVARTVVIGAGAIEISYMAGKDGKPVEIGRRNLDSQILDDQSLIISPADYRQAIRTAHAIFGGKNKRAR